MNIFENLSAQSIWVACFCAFLCVFFATLVIIDFIAFATNRYKDRYTEAAEAELDDVLLQMPASRIFDLSLALSALAAFLMLGVFCIFSSEMSWIKFVFSMTVPAIAAFPIPRLVLRHLKKVRIRKFNEQLEDALLSMSSSLKAGFSITQAIESVANENRKPISFEFRLLVQEIHLGVPLDDALRKMVARLDDNADFELVSTAIITARQTGGELTQVLERLAGVIRERIRIMQRVAALTAQGKMQATIIGAMPFLLLIAMMKIAPDMMNQFFGSIIGIALLAATVILVTVGFFVIKKITTIDI